MNPGIETGSLEVRRPSSALDSGSDLHRGCLSRLCCTLRFFQPLSALLPPNPSRPCFMPLALLGLPPSELSPCWNPKRLSTLAPLLTLPPASITTSYGKPHSMAPSTFGRLQGFTPPASPFIRCRALTRITAAGALLGLSPSKGLPRLAIETPSRFLLSRT
jgi:hypothetical protein